MATTHTASHRGTASRRAPAKPNALAQLKADHQEVADLLERFEKGKSRMESAKKQALALDICRKLTIHATIEEEIFYPAVADAVDDAEDLVEEAKVEHASLKNLISQIEDAAPDAGEFDALVKVLGEYVKHHVKEEQNEIFPLVRRSDLDLAGLGERLAMRKSELAGEAG
jgi:hemerythrin-like domain-containing protein